MTTVGEEDMEYESDPEEAKRSLAMRRREASDDEEGEGERREKPTVDRRVGTHSDESDGQGGAADYDDDDELGVEEDEEEEEVDEEEEEVEEGDEEEVYNESVREGETAHGAGPVGVESSTVPVPKETEGDERRSAEEESVNAHVGAQAEDEEEKKENEPFAVPTAGAFYMHDDRFRDNAGARHRRTHGGRKLWESKDDRKWGHDKFEELTSQERHYEEGRRSTKGHYRGRGRRGIDRGYGRGNRSKVFNNSNNQGQVPKGVRGKESRKYEPAMKNNGQTHTTHNKLSGKPLEKHSHTNSGRVFTPISKLESDPVPTRKNVFASSLNSASPPFYPSGSSSKEVTLTQKRDVQAGNTNKNVRSSVADENFSVPQTNALLRGKNIADSSSMEKLYIDDSVNSTSGKTLKNIQMPTGSSLVNTTQSSQSRAQGRVVIPGQMSHQPAPPHNQATRTSSSTQLHAAQRIPGQNRAQPAAVQTSAQQFGQRPGSASQTSSPPTTALSINSLEPGEVESSLDLSKSKTALIGKGKGISQGSGRGSHMYGGQVVGATGSMGISHGDQNFPGTPAFLPVMQFGGQVVGATGSTLAILQICIVVALTRILAFLIRPLRQPRVIAEIVGGILLGPSALGRNKDYLHAIFPTRSLTVLDTLANIGLLFFLFLVGLELDLKSLRRTGKQAFSIAVAGISLPFALGIGTSLVLRGTISKGVDGPPFLVFMGVALSITAFPVLARILAELKLLTTDIGRMAMSAAAVNDVAAWILLALAVALSGTGRSPLVSLWVFLCGSAFVLFCALVIPPIFKWMVQRCPEGEPVDELYVCATLASVLAAGFVTDLIGIHALFGAFVVGVLVPKEGPFAGALVEKVEDLVSGLLLPLYFVSSGLKTDVTTISGLQSWGLLVLVITTACLGKVVGTVAVSLFCRVPFKEALALGFLMNTKGLVELIVLNIGKDRKVLNDQTFAIMVLMAIFTTFITTPLVMAVYKPAKRASKANYKYRTIERKDPNTQLRIFACFDSTRNIPTMINLIEASRGTEKREKLCVYAMHLMELTERSSAILMVHKARKNGLPFWNKGLRSNCDQIVVAFEAFQQLSRVIIRPMTAISSMSTIHEDICESAESKRAAMIIMPFHKHQRLDGVLETTRNDFRWVNKRVLEHAPCSVGILVDRGLGGATHISASSVSSHVTVLFFGGHDDREALAYAARMAEHPGISLTVVHFIASQEMSGEIVRVRIDDDLESSAAAALPDEKLIAEVKLKVSNNDSIRYEERVVRNSTETIDAIRELSRSNLVLVGRTPEGPVAAALNVKSDCPELGSVGSLLTSPDFSTSATVLVVQHYHGKTYSSPVPSSKVEVLPCGEDSETN